MGLISIVSYLQLSYAVPMPRYCFTIIVFALIFLSANTVHGHGGVLLEDDVCIIKIGFLDAHFTGFKPSETGTKEFCEDLPKVAESVFVIDYLHDFLKEMRVDFRIIKDVEQFGFYANWDDIQTMDDIDSATVFYRRPTVERAGVYSVNYTFTEPGVYIGIVTAKHPDEDKTFRAVFPFQVGTTNWGLIPLFVLLIIAAQFAYLYLKKKG